MSFFHVLPSNVAPTSFPNNHASDFSTPIATPYHLSGKWQVALLNITYSSCINSFHHDTLVINKKFNLKDHVQYNDYPITFDLPQCDLPELIKAWHEKMDGVMSLALNKKNGIKRKFTLDPTFVILSHGLRMRLQLPSDVLCSWDQTDYHTVNVNKVYEDKDYTVTVIPQSYPKRTVMLKDKNEKIYPMTLLKRFNAVLADYLSLHIDNKTGYYMVTKHDNSLIIFSKALQRAMGLPHAGMYQQQEMKGREKPLFDKMDEDWQVIVMNIQGIEKIPIYHNITIELNSAYFQKRNDAVAYLNDVMNKHDVSFTLTKRNQLIMKINDAHTTITLSDTLRDIFAFDSSTYKGTAKASDIFSLTRRINYLYIYSNVSEYIRIGDTEAPLLAIIPFNSQGCVNRLQEKTFKNPMYVSVISNPISQIDIAIYDGAGQQIPFAAGAVTSLRLHFQQL